MGCTRSVEERQFHETEALRGAWSVRQLDRQISSPFFTHTMLSKNKRVMHEKGSLATKADLVTPEDVIKDPIVLEILGTPFRRIASPRPRAMPSCGLGGHSGHGPCLPTQERHNGILKRNLTLWQNF